MIASEGSKLIWKLCSLNRMSKSKKLETIRKSLKVVISKVR